MTETLTPRQEAAGPTPDVVPVVPVVEAADATPDQRRRTRLILAARIVILVVAALAGFHRTVTSLWPDLATGSGLIYVLAVPFYALLAAAAVRRRHRVSLPIHDRETDVIVGSLLLAVAIAASAFLGPGLTAVYYLWRIDMLMSWVFMLGASVLLFGLRPTVAYRRAWLVLALIWPLPLRTVTFTIGHGSIALATWLQVLVVVAILWSGRRTRTVWRFAAPTAALIVGVALVLLLDPGHHVPMQPIPPLGACAAGAVIWWIGSQRFWSAARGGPGSVRPLDRSLRPSVTRPFVGLAIIVVAAAVAAVLVPAPPRLAPIANVTAPTARPADLVPAGWTTVSSTAVTGGPAHLFGAGAGWQRLVLRADGVSSATDAVDGLGRHRLVAVDVVTTRRVRTLALYPVQTTYRMGTLMLSPTSSVDLGGGVVGQLFGATDARKQLTYSLLTFTWTAGPGRWQRVTLLSVDDHRTSAAFPAPENAIGDSVKSVATGIARGHAAQVSTGVVKDADLLRSLATAISARRTGT